LFSFSKLFEEEFGTWFAINPTGTTPSTSLASAGSILGDSFWYYGGNLDCPEQKNYLSITF
jgi:hypothetical protein